MVIRNVKTKESIIAKWKKVYEAAYAKAMWERKAKVEQEKERNKNNLDRKIAQIDRKILARLKRKELDCDRKCKNEIRKLEGKEERVYKVKKKKLNKLDFALNIAQENVRLRDTDDKGRWFCISCWYLKEWWELAWWHYIPRWVKNICLHHANINAQCHYCNNLMWPYKTTPAWIWTTIQYRENLIEKYWKETVEQLEKKKNAYFKKWYESNWDYGQWNIDLDDFIDDLIKENEERWSRKEFYKPWKNWRKIWEESKGE